VLKIFEVECSKGLKLKVQIQFKFKSCSVQIQLTSILFSPVQEFSSISILFNSISVQVQFKFSSN